MKRSSFVRRLGRVHYGHVEAGHWIGHRDEAFLLGRCWDGGKGMRSTDATTGRVGDAQEKKEAEGCAGWGHRQRWLGRKQHPLRTSLTPVANKYASMRTLQAHKGRPQSLFVNTTE